MTEQEIFDKVVTHLFAQGKPAKDIDGEGCMYRAPDGCKCAVGCLIPDDIYHPRMEWNDIRKIVLHYSELQNLLPHLPMLMALQNIHDRDCVWVSKDHLLSALEPIAIAKQLCVGRLIVAYDDASF